MTGDEHYAEAERLLQLSEGQAVADDLDWFNYLVARAHVHALLAVAGGAVMEVEVVHANPN